jgi:hypothetical protein
VEDTAAYFDTCFGYKVGKEMNPAEFYIDSSYKLVADVCW